ncbi:MAG: acyl dehydratase, partial [Proteobacteria bacterium]|nr:acyl dehydratase [Pseudomonadota bacterium]
MTEPLHVHFEDLEIGQVIPLGACAVDAAALELFVERFLPGWDTAYGAPEGMVYALWSRLSADRMGGWAGSKTLAVDGLRFLRNP